MTTELPKKIVLKALNNRYDEGRGAATITPGMLVQRDDDSNIIKHATAGGPASLFFPVEESFVGKTIDDDYAIGDLVRYHMAAPGDEIYSLLADGESVAPGDYLESAGDGTFQARTTGVALATSLELVEADGVSRLKIQCL